MRAPTGICPASAMRKALTPPARGFPTARRLVAAHWGVLAVCAGFLLVGALAFDDYGTWEDGPAQRVIGISALDYLAGDGERAFEQLHPFHDRYYGTVLEASLVLIERILDLEYSRDVYLSRHLLTHLFFLSGGVFCYLLVLRMFGNRLLALIAMVIFLLHPRLYAHSFFNSKDATFVSIFMISLYLVHRAFRRDTLSAFLLCGVGVGLSVTFRSMGIILFAAVLALRGLDLISEERKHVLLTAGGFALTAILAYYAMLPALWVNPGRFLDVLRTGAMHPNPALNLFRGEWLSSRDGAPFEYIPVWIGITTPPLVLLAATIGALWLCWRAARSPQDVCRKTPLRFNMLMLVFILSPIIAIFSINANIYHGWRQVYFLYSPLVILAILGLHWIADSFGNWRVKAGLYALTVAGISVTVISMTKIHPLESDYFNVLLDRNLEDGIVLQYEMDYLGTSGTKLMKEILEDHPDQTILFPREYRSFFYTKLLTDRDRKRVGKQDVLFFDGFLSTTPVSERTYEKKIYNNTIRTIRVTSVDVEIENQLKQALSRTPVSHSTFTTYTNGRMLAFLKDDCSLDFLENIFRISFYPVDTAVLSSWDKEWRSETMAFSPSAQVLDDSGRCVWGVILPPYPVASIFIRQCDGTDCLPGKRFGVTPLDVDATVLAREPLASGKFDIYRDDAEVIYVKDPCMEDDIEAIFGINFYPLDPVDLPDDRKRSRFDELIFRFWDNGVRIGDRCVAVVPLPDYPVVAVQTGQLDMTGWLWEVSFGVTPPEVDPAVLARDPLASSVFDVYRDGDALGYVRDGCTAEDIQAAFLLHIVPVDADDLPAERAQYGFDNLDFAFWQRGGMTGGRCVAVVALPDYPIASVFTGQYDETGQLWTAEFALPE